MNKFIAIATVITLLVGLFVAVNHVNEKTFIVSSHYTQDHRVFHLTAKKNTIIKQIDFNGGCGSVVYSDNLIVAKDEVISFERVCTRLEKELLVTIKTDNQVQMYY